MGFSNPGGTGNGFREEQNCTAKAEALASGQVEKVDMIARNADVNQQLADLRPLIANKPDAIVFNPSNADGLQAALDEAQAAGIVTVAVDAFVTDPETWKFYNNQVDYAYLGAKWLFEQLGGTGKVWYPRGIAGHPADIDRDTGFKKALAEYPGIEAPPNEGGVHTGWDPTTATNLANEFISSGEYDKIDGIWTSGMDSQVVDAVKNAGKPYKPIVGADLGAFAKYLLDDVNYPGLVGAADLLLEASGISKTYGAVVALRSASLAVRPGEVHALMGANGAGKSTLVKILTGAVRPDSGTIAVRGRPRIVHSPGEARRGGLVSVYQEPALIPDLDIRSNLRLTETPIEPFRHWLRELGVDDLDLLSTARHVPLASLRIIDLARALAIEPDVLMLDEMTAALPANLTERVLEVIGRLRGGDRSGIFISHRLIEIGAVCGRATVLREGETVGVVDVDEGSEERIVELMLGDIVKGLPGRDGRRATGGARATAAKPRLTARNLASGTKLQDVSFDLAPGEVLGVVALEGQGQDELFDVLAGSERASSGELLVDGSPVSFHHPADAIRAGLVFVAADRAEALLIASDLKEIPLVCDRPIVIFGGRVVSEIDAASADETALLRAAYNLRSDALMPEDVAAEAVAGAVGAEGAG